MISRSEYHSGSKSWLFDSHHLINRSLKEIIEREALIREAEPHNVSRVEVTIEDIRLRENGVYVSGRYIVYYEEKV